MVANSYIDYLSKVSFKEIKLSDLNTKLLRSLKLKNGVLIVDQGNIGLSLMHKFESMTILNTVSILERMNDFIIIDPFGITIYEGSAEDIIEFVDGFYNNDKEL